MPGRTIPLVNEEYYHIYNRGTEKRDIFLNSRDYKRFQQTFYYYQFADLKTRFSNFIKSDLNSLEETSDDRLVEIIGYCLMPNHFHFLLKQLKDNGISIFLSKLSNSYTKYFNTKYDRVGALLQGVFKSCIVENDDYFLHLSRYIHLNPVRSGMVANPQDYMWSSYNEYITNRSLFIVPDPVLTFFKDSNGYREFVSDFVGFNNSLGVIENLTLEQDDI